MALPPRVYYTLQEVTARWGCNIADVAGWADASRFRILTGIPAIRCGDEVVAGKVVLSPMELLPLFRRCGTGPTEGVMRRIQPVGRQDWLLITDPTGGIPIAVALSRRHARPAGAGGAPLLGAGPEAVRAAGCPDP